MDLDAPLDQPPTFQTDLPGIEVGPAIAKISLTLVALIALMVVTVWFLKRIMHKRNRVANANQLIQIVESRTLSPKTMLYVISIDGEKHLIAESQVEVRSIGKIAKEF